MTNKKSNLFSFLDLDKTGNFGFQRATPPNLKEGFYKKQDTLEVFPLKPTINLYRCLEDLSVEHPMIDSNFGKLSCYPAEYGSLATK